MLAKRVIPCMDVKDGRVVKGVNFVNLRDAGDPIELAQRYDEQRADEVIFLDITATSDKRETTVDLASRASAQLHLPYCVGGGFRSVADIRRMIAAGADKVSVNSAAVDNPQLISDAAAAFGTQAILCAIDAKQVAGNPNKWEVYVHGGRTATGIDAVEWAVEAARRGAGEILLTSMDRDGSKDGFDCALTRAVARAVDIPVIGQARALRRGHHRRRGRRGAGRQRLPLRRVHGNPGQGVHAQPGHPRAPIERTIHANRASRPEIQRRWADSVHRAGRGNARGAHDGVDER